MVRLLKFRYRGVTVEVERVSPFGRWFFDSAQYLIRARNKTSFVQGDGDLYGDVLRFVDDCIIAEGD